MPGVMLMVLALAAIAQDLTPPPLAPSIPVLEVAVDVRDPDGRHVGNASDSGVDPFDGYLIANISGRACSVEARATQPVELFGTGWHVSGETLRRDRDQLVVKVVWQRLWTDGQWMEDGPRGSTQLTLKAGDHVGFDALETTGSSHCAAATLAAGVVNRAPWQLKKARTPGSATGAVSGSSGAVTTRRSGPDASRPSPPAGMTIGVDLELWLVDTWADGSEHAQRHLVKGSASIDPFQFASTRVAATNGTATVDVRGVLSGTTGAGLRLQLFRRVTDDGRPPLDTLGTSTINLARPDPNDVVGIDLPPWQGAERLLAGHTFSLRLRTIPGR